MCVCVCVCMCVCMCERKRVSVCESVSVIDVKTLGLRPLTFTPKNHTEVSRHQLSCHLPCYLYHGVTADANTSGNFTCMCGLVEINVSAFVGQEAIETVYYTILMSYIVIKNSTQQAYKHEFT